MNSELNIDNKLELNNKNTNVTFEKQKTFLESNLGQVINGGVDLGIRAVLPDMIEDEVINIKNSILTEGFSAGIKTAIDSVIDLGKSVLGIFTGKFENMSQVKSVIKNGGLIDSISKTLDWGINKARENDLINNTTASIIKKGKNTILNTVSNNIENNLTSQIESIEKIDTYIENWNKYYKNQDFNSMDKQYKKIEKELKNILPLENILIRARQLENLHLLIKNNGNNFNVSNEALELANKLV